MGLCQGRACGCAIQSSSLSISGSGTPGSPWQVELPASAVLLNDYSFVDAAERDFWLPSPTEGQDCFIRSLDERHHWDGTAWRVWYKPKTTYTPTLTSITLGTGGTSVGLYTRFMDMVFVDIRVVLGTGGVLTGAPTISIPVVASLTGSTRRVMNGMAYDASATTGYALEAEGFSSTTVSPYRATGSGVITLGASNPFLWAVSDEIWLSGAYPAA